MIKTTEKVRIIGKNNEYIKRVVYLDETGQKFIQFNGKFWKYPQEVEY